MIYRHAAGCIIYTIDAHRVIHYLLLRYQAGHWDFAKGHTHDNESLVQTARREVFEETGILVNIDHNFNYEYSYHLIGENRAANKTVHLFVAEVRSTLIQLSDEHTDYAWLDLEQALKTLTYENAVQALKKADDWIHHKI